MVENIAPCTRLFVLVCAAVMLFVMCPDAARASPITIQVDNEVKHKVRRRLYTPKSQHHQLFTGQLSPETGLQSGPPSNTKTIWHYRKAPSIIDHQPKPLGFTEGSFGYNQNSPDNRQSYAGMTRVQSEMLPANSMSTSNNPHVGENVQGLKSSENYHPTNGNLYNSYPAIIRRASYKDPASPYFQSSSRSVVRNPSIAQKSYQKENVPSSFFSNEAEDKSVWQPPEVSPFSSQTRRYSSTSLPTPRMSYSRYKETDELPGSWAQSTSRAIQSRKYPSVAGQTAPQAPLISDSLDAYVIKSSPSTEPQRSSITDFSQGWPSTRNSEVLREKNGQSYLFKNSQTSFDVHQSVKTATGDRSISYPTISHTQRPSDTPLYGMFPSNLQQRGPTKYIKQPSERVNPMYQSASVAQYGAQTDSFKQSHHTTAGNLVQTLVLPAPGTDDTRKTLVPIAQADFPGNYATVSEESVPSSPANTTSSGSMQTQKSGRIDKSMYGFRGFKDSMWRALKEQSRSLNGSTKSLLDSFDKSKFKIKKVYPSLSQRYSIRQRELLITTTTTPQKNERNPSAFSSSPNSLNIIKTMKDPRPITSGVKEVRSLIPDSHVGLKGNMGTRKMRIYRRNYGPDGFSNQPLEGAKALLGEPDKSTRVKPDLGGFKPRSSKIQQPVRYGYNKTGKIEPGRRHGSVSENEPKLPLKTSQRSESDHRFTPDNYKKNHKIYNFHGFQPVPTRIQNAFNKATWKSKEQTQNQPISSAFLRSAGPLKTPMKASLLNSSTSSTVRGKRVKGKQANAKKLNESNSVTNDAWKVAILRLPKIPARVKAFSHSDILGSALFSGIRAKSQTPVTPTHKKHIQHITATIKQEAQAAHWNLNSEDAVFTKNQTISSAFLRSAGPLKTPMKASLLNSSTSSTVRGKRVKGKQANAKMLNESISVTNDLILRLPKIPARVKAFSHSDILGSALFSGVRAKSQTPVTPTHKKSIQNITATIKQEAQAAHWNLNSEGAVFTKDNSSRRPEKPAEDELKDFRIVKNNTLDLGDIDLKTSDLIPDNDRSGSGEFDMFDVFSTTSKSLSEDLLELDYLRISTGNVSFKSMNVSNNEK